MTREKVLTCAEDFCLTYPTQFTKSKLNFFVHFEDSIHMFAEYISLTFMSDNAHQDTVDSFLKMGLQFVIGSWESRSELHQCYITMLC